MADKRGVLYIVWGDGIEPMLNRSIESLKRVHPELPVHVERLKSKATLLDKAAMVDVTPFEETLFLDADTVVLDRLDFGFEKGRQFGLACGICECPWARRYGAFRDRLDMIEYNTGVLFFTAKAREVFRIWGEKGASLDSSIRFFIGNEMRVMPHNDQAGFALGVEESGISPFVLPYNWNFRPMWHRSFWGPIKVWHDYRDVPREIVEWTKSQADPKAVMQYAEGFGNGWRRA